MIKSEDGFTFTVGDRVFNYYDMKPGTIATSPDWEGWFDVKQDDGSVAILNGPRICSIGFAQAKGWLS